MSLLNRQIFIFSLGCLLAFHHLDAGIQQVEPQKPVKPFLPDMASERVWQIQIPSFEVETTGTLEIRVEATCLKKDGRVFQPVLLEGPQQEWLTGWEVHPRAKEQFGTKVGNTYPISFFLFYDPENLPFTYRRFQIGMRDQDGELVERVNGYVYFTPYGTTEVWSANDFEALNRRWDSMHQPEKRRQKWDPSQLGYQSKNLLAAGGFGEPMLRLEKPQNTKSLPGLAYSIPIEGVPDESLRQYKNDFAGTVEGQVVVQINGNDLNIADIAVEVWEMDIVNGNRLLTTGYTGDDGHFSIYFQGSGGGAEMYVFIAVVSHNQSDMIRVRDRLGVIRNESFFRNAPATFEAGVERTHDFGRIEADTNLAKPQLLHWANRARQFVDSKIPGVLPDVVSERLDIMRSFVGSSEAYFFPGGYKWDLIFVSAFVFGQFVPISPVIVGGVGAILISNHDGIYVGMDRETDENVTYHEFGHYLMWHLQGQSWIDILQASFAHHTTLQNNPNPKITWTEGFATGFSNIVDTWSQADDGEFGSDGFGDYEARKSGGILLENLGGLTHGFFSEWNVGCALYDLWDGPSQALQDGSFLSKTKDYDDAGMDQVEIPFADIVLPLQNHAGTGGFHMPVTIFGINFGNDQEQYLLTNIVEYHGALMDVISPDCLAMRQVTDLWNDDLVNNFFPTNFLDADLLSSDMLAFSREVLVGAAPSIFSVDVTQLLNENDEYNLSNFESVPNTTMLSDDLLISGDPIRGSATLFINGARTFGWQTPANSYAQPRLPGIPPADTLDVDLCGNMTLEIREGGKIIVGEPNAPAATVRLTSGSTLILGGDTNGAVLAEETTYHTLVSMGSLEINDGSRFVVEAGATLIYNRGGNILLHGDNSVLEIYGDIIVSEMANFRPEGDGEVIFGLPDLGGNPNVTVNNASVIQFLELDIRVLPFTYFRPDDNASVRFLMEHGTAGMGSGSYIHTGLGPLLMEYMDYFCTDSGFHQGVWINNVNHSISEISVSGGAPGLWGQSTTSPLVVSESTILNCDTGILAEAGGVGFEHGTIASCAWAGIDSVAGIVTAEDVVFDLNHQAIHSNRGGGTLLDVTIRDGDIGWRAEDPETKLEILSSSFSNHAEFGIYVNSYNVQVTLDHVLMEFNQVGMRAQGTMDVRLDCSDFIDNIESGITMADGARLDIGNNATNTFAGSDVNLTLEDAALPNLNGGHNWWTTAEAGDFNILGTIVFGTCTCTPGQDAMGNPVCADPWYFSEITGELSFYDNSFTTPVASKRIEIFDAATGQCGYLLQTSDAALTCQIVP